MENTADLILYGGSIVTMDEGNQTTAEAIAITGERIVAVGRMDGVFRLQGSKTVVIYLDQQTLMPGFIEPHQHAASCGQFRCQLVDLGGATFRSYREIRLVIETRVQELFAEQDSVKWGMFCGWDPELVTDLPMLSAAFLDAAFQRSVPVIVLGQSTHVAWANSKALERARNVVEKHPSSSFVRDEHGRLTGKIFGWSAIEETLDSAPAPTEDELRKSARDQFRFYGSVGFTTVTELGYSPNPSYDRILKEVTDRDDCPIRLALYRFISVTSKGDTDTTQIQETPSPGVGDHSNRLWEAGLKLIADGSPHCGTAAVREPYLSTPLTETLGFPKPPGCGVLHYSKTPMLDTVKKHHLQGRQLAIHCHGERSIEQVLETYEEVLSEHPGDYRHRMEHLGLMTPEQIARAGKLNLALSFFVDHLRFYGLVYKTDIFGDRVNRWAPLSEATKSGVIWTIHQDHPAFPGQPSPFSNIKTAVTRCTRDDPNTPYGPEYRVSVHEALKAYTVNAAWQLHLEKDVGSITVGKKADLVVLSENPYNVEPVDLERISVIETFIDGHRNNFAELKCLNETSIHILQRPVDA